MTKLDKDRRITEETKDLLVIFKDMPDDKARLTGHLIQNAAFMAVTLEDLQEDIKKNGALLKCQSGNGFYTVKDNPAQKAYATMVSRYLSVINTLLEMLPNNQEKKDSTARLVDFIGSKQIEIT